jgi:hypothetical protein
VGQINSSIVASSISYFCQQVRSLRASRNFRPSPAGRPGRGDFVVSVRGLTGHLAKPALRYAPTHSILSRGPLGAPFRPFDGRHADGLRRVGSCHSFPAIGRPRCATRGTINTVRSAMHPERCAHCVCRHIGRLSPLRALCRRTCREQRFASSTRERRQLRRRGNRGACRCATASTGSAGREPYSVSWPFSSTAR